MILENDFTDILNSHINNPLEKENFNREHIFYDIKNIIRDSLSNNQLIDMYHNFSLYEKCLNLSRNGQLNLATYWVNQATKNYENLEKSLIEPLGLLYYPMIAYFYYIKKEYEIALNFLQIELQIIDSYIKDDNLKLEFKLEQFINLYRIAYAKNDIKNIEIYGTNILSFIVLNHTDEKFFTEKNSLLLLNKSHKSMWIDYVMNAILIKPLTHNENKVIEQMFKNLKQMNVSNSNLKEFESIMDIAINNKFIENNFKKVIKILNTYPSYLQFLILNKLKHFAANNLKLSNIINNYIVTILKIEIV